MAVKIPVGPAVALADRRAPEWFAEDADDDGAYHATPFHKVDGAQSAQSASFSLHCGDHAVVDVSDAGDAGQRHRHVEFAADDLNRARDTGLPAGAEAVDVSAAAHAGARAERQRAQNVLSGADAAVEHDLDVAAERIDDRRQHGDRGRRAVELAAAVVGYDERRGA